MEVAVALSVVIIGVTALLGTWPSGQMHLRKAGDMTIASLVAQRLAAEAEQADFSDLLKLTGISGGATMGTLPRRYFTDAGIEVTVNDPARAYEAIEVVSHRSQLPVQAAGGPSRWDSQGQLVVSVEVTVSPSGGSAPVGADGLVDRTRWRRPVLAFPFVVGGNASW